MITRHRLTVAAVLVPAAVLLVACSDSGDDAERITSYDVLVDVRDDGSLRVTETIAYDFGGEDRHGVERRVPQRLPYEQTRDRFTRITDVEVSSPSGAPDDLEQSTDGGDVVLRIGDDDAEVTGEQTYVIAYDVDAVASAGADGDEVVWDAVGTGWEVPIDAATATVDLPATAESSACVAGPAGSTRACEVSGDGEVVAASVGSLDPEEGMTVTAVMATGSVDTTPEFADSFSPARAFSAGPLQLGVAVLLLALVLVPVVRRVRRAHVPDGGGGPSDAPPGGLRPAQLGTVLDGSADLHEVTATVLDLAARGVVRVEEADVDGDGDAVERTGDDPPVNWRVTSRVKGVPPELLPYEQQVVRLLFGEGLRGGTSVLLSTVHAERRSGLAEVRAAMHRDALDNGWFTDDPARVRQRWYLLAAGLLVVGVAVTPVLALFTTFAWAGVALFVSGVVVLLLAHRMPVRTAAGEHLLVEVRRYRDWLRDSTPDASVLEEHLPAAVALQTTGSWTDALSADGAPPAPSWYVTTHPGATTVWPWMFVLTSSGGSPAASGSSSSGVSAGAGGGGGGSW